MSIKSYKYKIQGSLVIFAVFLLFAFLLISRWQARERLRDKEKHNPDDQSTFIVTGYCNCGKCCGWERNWFGFGVPVYKYGKLKGKTKKVGVTASGKKARHGTVAADPAVFPFGTKLEIPGYGIGVVEDLGGAIKGRHIDVWFSSHTAAKRWGVKRLRLRVLNNK